jgi:predicted membrane-bound dolichyl-phosphate-mannose-protein mannosyltransferase
MCKGMEKNGRKTEIKQKREKLRWSMLMDMMNYLISFLLGQHETYSFYDYATSL